GLDSNLTLQKVTQPARSKGVFIEVFGFKNPAQKKSCPKFRTVGGTTAWHWRYYHLTHLCVCLCTGGTTA
ncbi:unnamed protein product, partial [Musa textilis]